MNFLSIKRIRELKVSLVMALLLAGLAFGGFPASVFADEEVSTVSNNGGNNNDGDGIVNSDDDGDDGDDGDDVDDGGSNNGGNNNDGDGIVNS
ncbi:MAG TPA: hypothetical protein VLA19_26780 [Herpetosiphonaceae bacterium]|nr:hypothetical protein [Herpetosiphonaceae bacterium]